MYHCLPLYLGMMLRQRFTLSPLLVTSALLVVGSHGFSSTSLPRKIASTKRGLSHRPSFILWLSSERDSSHDDDDGKERIETVESFPDDVIADLEAEDQPSEWNVMQQVRIMIGLRTRYLTRQTVDDGNRQVHVCLGGRNGVLSNTELCLGSRLARYRDWIRRNRQSITQHFRFHTRYT